MTGLSKNYCALPFHHLQVRNDGSYNICCEHTTPVEAAVNIKHYDHKVWLDSDYVQHVRNSFVNGDRHEGCSRCWQREDQGFDSLRLRSAREYSILPDRHDQPIKNIEIMIGNLCNLRCLMCNEQDSSAILAENIRLEVNQIQQSDLAWQDTAYDHLQRIFDLRPHVINIRGGEPLYNKKLLEILQNIPVSQAQNMMLHITTNATVWNDQWYKVLEKFRLVRFMFSVDAINGLYEYIRYPASWPAVEKNIASMMSLSNSKCLIHCVAQNLNISAVGDLIRWCQAKAVYLDIDTLVNPEYLQISNLPTAQKQIAIANLTEILYWPLEIHVDKFVRSSLDSLTGTDFDSRLWTVFVDYISRRDDLRGNNFRHFIKEQ